MAWWWVPGQLPASRVLTAPAVSVPEARGPAFGTRGLQASQFQECARPGTRAKTCFSEVCGLLSLN